VSERVKYDPETLLALAEEHDESAEVALQMRETFAGTVSEDVWADRHMFHTGLAIILRLRADRAKSPDDETSGLLAKLRYTLEALRSEHDVMVLGPSEMVAKANGVFMAIERIERDVLGR